MTKYQVFLIVVFLFFFGSGGGWVLELFFRRFFSGANPERKWLNPGFLFGPCVPRRCWMVSSLHPSVP